MRLKSLEVDPARTRNEILKELDPNFTPPESEAESPQEGDKKDVKTPALRAFGRDLTELAKKGELDPVIGRKNEIERVIQILCRRTKNNPVLIGEAGLERPPSSKAWLKKPRLATCRNCWAINASSRSISR